MSDYHSFEQGGDNFLFFSRSARLYQLSDLASRMFSELQAPQGVGRTGPAPGPPRALFPQRKRRFTLSFATCCTRN